MRLPDLNWPDDLFDDGTAPRPDAAEAPSPAVVASANLWRAMADTWTAQPPPPALQWRVPPSGADRPALAGA